MSQSLIDLILLFFVYSFAGWCTEVVFAAVNTGKFVNRGFLNGPLCPIYGYGILPVLYLLEPVKNNLLILFAASVIITSLAELVTGFLAEKILHLRLWDYSDIPFNLGGYICLKFSLAWGFACVFVIRLIHPLLAALISLIPPMPGLVLVCVFSAAFLADLVLTMIEALKLPKRIQAINDLENALRTISDGIGENLSGTVFSVQEKNEALKERMSESKRDFDERVNESRRELEERMEKSKREFQEISEKLKTLAAQKNIVHNRLISAFPYLLEGKQKSAFERIRSSWAERKGKK